MIHVAYNIQIFHVHHCYTDIIAALDLRLLSNSPSGNNVAKIIARDNGRRKANCNFTRTKIKQAALYAPWIDL